MSDLYESMRAFIRAEVRAEVTAAKFELRETLTREAPKVIEGPPGPAGKDGANARGITSVETRDGRLLFRFTDNTEQDVGRIVGEKGEPGERGKSLNVHNSSVAPANPGMGDLWIVP